MSFNECHIVGKSQGGEFVLEEKVKRQKLFAPKGPVKAQTCYRYIVIIYRSLPRCFWIYLFPCLVKGLNSNSSRVTDLQAEVLTWQTVFFRSWSFLNKENFGDLPKNKYGEFPSADIMNLTDAEERYLEINWTVGDISLIKLKYLRVLPKKDTDHLLYTREQEE